MARKKQQLINYHTSGVTNMPQVEDVALGEIVVRHATDKPELLIKKDNNEFATFVDSSKVESMISASSIDLQGQINAISNNLEKNYATSADTKAAIEAVDVKFGSYATSADTKAAISAVDTKLDKAVSSLTDTINTKISSAYIYKGSCTYAQLSEKEQVIGHVYNVTDAHDNVPAGTNYAWDGTSWDALAGIVNLTIYATSADTVAAIKVVQDDVDAVENNLKNNYANSANTVAAIKAVDDKLTKDYATSAATVAAIKVVQDDVDAVENNLKNNYATSAATVAAIKVVDDKFGGYATSADTKAAISAVQGNVDTLKNSVTGLSASTVTIQGVANSAVQNVVVANTDANKITATKTDENNVVTLNFNNMVIDCGEF